MAGYSQTPLVKKLGIKPGFRISIINEPADFLRTLGEVPDGLHRLKAPRAPMDMVIIFSTEERRFTPAFEKAAATLASTGMIWAAWPKKSANVPTDLRFENVQRIGLDAGLVDVKICAIDEVWTGLKFVIRLKDRAGRR